jgi:hypothetical protein
MTANYGFIAGAFQFASTWLEEHGSAYGPVSLQTALTAMGYPGGYATLVPAPPGTVGLEGEVANIGYATGLLTYIPGGWREVSFGGIRHPIYYPASFTGQIPYKRAEAFLNLIEEPVEWFQETVTVSIISPSPFANPNTGQYSLSFQSGNLTGTCPLDTSSDGSVLFGLLNVVLVSVTGWPYVEGYTPPKK